MILTPNFSLTLCNLSIESCHITRNCSPYAVCAPEGDGYACRCLEGYVGNGYQCEADSYPFSEGETYPYQPGLKNPIYPDVTIKPYDPFQDVLSKPVGCYKMHCEEC